MHRKLKPFYVLHVTSHISTLFHPKILHLICTVAYLRSRAEKMEKDVSKRDSVHSRRHQQDDKTTTMCSLTYTTCWLEGMA
jgi:hypothetical protein